MANFNLLFDFDNTNGASPQAALYADGPGNLYLTATGGGGPNSYGTVVELAKTGTGYATTPTVLVTFNGTNESFPATNLISDAAGNLYGTTTYGGTEGQGSIFEIVKTANGYSAAPTLLASFNGLDGQGPHSGLVADAAGNLFGTTTYGGANAKGVVYELAKTATGYAISPTVLASFTGVNGDGANPDAPLLIDKLGNLFGVTLAGGDANGDGVLFELPKLGGSYATTPTNLFGFNGANGSYPIAGLIADAAGDLFGVTSSGGDTNKDGSVFELVKTGDGYAASPITLALFNGADGNSPFGSLLIDGAGNLFGTTALGGLAGNGTVFEVAKTGNFYASTPTTLFNFNGATQGGVPFGGLIADAAGDLFGTASTGGDANNDGLVFELNDTGFVACYGRGTLILTDGGEVAVEDLAIGDTVVTAAGALEPVRWIGRRSYTGRFLTGKAHLLPILFRAGSLGDGLPHRDLRVSPAHAMFLDGLLVPAACLVNGTSIIQERDCRRVDYFHIELAAHDVIVAEGAASETFVDDRSRGMFHNASEYAVLYPNSPAAQGFCAPRIESGFQLDVIRQRLAEVEGAHTLAA